MAVNFDLEVSWVILHLLVSFFALQVTNFLNCTDFEIVTFLFTLGYLLEDVISSPSRFFSSDGELPMLTSDLSIYLTEVCLLSVIVAATSIPFLHYFLTSKFPFYNNMTNNKDYLWIKVQRDFVTRVLVTSIIIVVILLTFTFPIIKSKINGNLLLWFGNLMFTPIYIYASMAWCCIIAFSITIAVIARKQMSKTCTRKVFHLAVVVMFSPAIVISSLLSFLSLCLGGALCIFIIVEFIRCFVLANVTALSTVKGTCFDSLKSLTATFDEFMNSFEDGNSITSPQFAFYKPIIFSHISLLLGVASTIWIYCRFIATESHITANDDTRKVLLFLGLATVGVGDAAASVFGSLYGVLRWSGKKKTLIGSFAAFISMCLYSLVMLYAMDIFTLRTTVCVILTMALTALAEAFTTENDNIYLPMYSTIIFLSTLEISNKTHNI